MANSLLGALRALLLSNSELEKHRIMMPGQERTSVYLQKAPDGLDLSRGIVIVLDDVSNNKDRTTEALMFDSTVSVVIFSSNADLLVEAILPLLWDILEDEERQMDISQHAVTNLEIINHRLMLEENCDKFGNDIYALTVECKIEHMRSRKGSE